MQSLCDINVLIALIYEGHLHHGLAKTWLNRQNDKDAIAICRVSQLGLLRILTTKAAMGDAVLTMEAAWQTYELLMQDERFIFLPEPAWSTMNVGLKQLTTTQQASPKVWQDAYLAAFALECNLKLVTFDRGFQKFAHLKLELL